MPLLFLSRYGQKDILKEVPGPCAALSSGLFGWEVFCCWVVGTCVIELHDYTIVATKLKTLFLKYKIRLRKFYSGFWGDIAV